MKIKPQAQCLLFVLALLCASTAFAKPAQESAENKNAISFLDVMPLFKGFINSDSDADLFFFYLAPSYERLVAPHFSIGTEVDLCFGEYTDDISYFYLGMSVVTRYYPISVKLEEFYIGMNLGFNVQSIDGETDSEDGGFVGPLIGLEAGYKLVFGDVFYMEPSMAYVYSKYNLSRTPVPLGWQGGLRIGIVF